MSKQLQEHLNQVITPSICVSEDVFNLCQEKLETDNLTKAEDELMHFSTFFLPYSRERGEVFTVYHKKADRWLFPGGHIEAGELPYETVNREIEEELGVKDFYESKPKFFLVTIVNIDNDRQVCRRHYDLWYLMETDQTEFVIDHDEFADFKWVTLSEADELITDNSCRAALSKLS